MTVTGKKMSNNLETNFHK